MPPKEKKPLPFKPTGEFGLGITRHLLAKAENAVAAGLPANQGDFDYTTFIAENETLANSIATAHPGPAGDHPKLLRENYRRQKEKFEKWLVTSAGKF